MDSNQGTLVINPHSQEWYTLDKLDSKPANPLTFYEDWDSVKLDDRMSWSSKRDLWPTQEKDKPSRIGTNRAFVALVAIGYLLALASLAMSFLMYFGMIGSFNDTCACSKQEAAPTAPSLASYSSKLKGIEDNLTTFQTKLEGKDKKINELLRRVAQLEQGTAEPNISINAEMSALKTRLNITSRKLQTLEDNLNESLSHMHSIQAEQINKTRVLQQRADNELETVLREVNASLRYQIQSEVAQLWLNMNSSLRCRDNLSAFVQNLAVQMNSTYVALKSVDAKMEQSVSQVNTSLGQKINADVNLLWTRLDVTTKNLQTLDGYLNKSVDNLAEQLNNVTQEIRSTEETLQKAVGEVHGNTTARYAAHLQELSNLSQSLNQTNIQLKALKSDTNIKTIEIKGMVMHLQLSVNSSLRCCDNLSVFSEQMNKTFSLLRSANVKLQRQVKVVNTSLNEETAYLAVSLIEVSARANKTETALDEFKTNSASELEKLNSTVFSLKEAEAELSSALQEVNSSLLFQLQNSSKSPGPPGPAGFNGSRGPPGPQGLGNLSLCRYNKMSAKSTAGLSAKVDVFFTEADDKKILGATCSTQGGAEYQFSSFISLSGKQGYRCKCKGKLPSDGSNSMFCFIHYWECPLITN